MPIILVVDDEQMVLSLVAAALQLKDHNVLVALDHKEAVEVASKSAARIDLLIVDQSVHNGPGRPLVEELLLLQPQAKVLRISGQSECCLRDSGLIRPDSFFLQKPFGFVELITKVNDVLSSPKPGPEKLMG